MKLWFNISSVMFLKKFLSSQYLRYILSSLVLLKLKILFQINMLNEVVEGLLLLIWIAALRIPISHSNENEKEKRFYFCFWQFKFQTWIVRKLCKPSWALKKKKPIVSLLIIATEQGKNSPGIKIVYISLKIFIFSWLFSCQAKGIEVSSLREKIRLV